jgi:hypothetical protein
VIIVPRPHDGPHCRFSTTFPHGSRADLSAIACYYMTGESDTLNWVMPNFVRDGWALGDCSIEHIDEGGVQMTWRTLRRGVGAIASYVRCGDNTVLFEVRPDGSMESRVVRDRPPADG